jgi:hypothetical protein
MNTTDTTDTTHTNTTDTIDSLYYLIEIEIYLKVLFFYTSIMSTRCCLECRKVVKSLSGLSRHIYRCPVVTGKKTSVVRNILAKTLRCSSKSDSTEQTDRGWIGLEDVTVQTEGIDDSKWIDLNEEAIPSSKSNYQFQSRLSTMALIRVDSYEEVTGKKAGQIFDDSDIPSHDGSSQFPRRSPEYLSRYHPFQSETDFVLA